MKLFRCRICGDPYLGEEAPANCPFCGAARKYLVPAEQWKDENKVKLTEASRKNLEDAISLELKNVNFYDDVSMKGQTEVTRALFKALKKVELEHATLFRKLLGLEKLPETNFPSAFKPQDLENLKESNKRENNALAFYAKAAKEAKEPRVSEVFTAIGQVEQTHADITDQMMSRK